MYSGPWQLSSSHHLWRIDSRNRKYQRCPAATIQDTNTVNQTKWSLCHWHGHYWQYICGHQVRPPSFSIVFHVAVSLRHSSHHNSVRGLERGTCYCLLTLIICLMSNLTCLQTSDSSYRCFVLKGGFESFNKWGRLFKQPSAMPLPLAHLSKLSWSLLLLYVRIVQLHFCKLLVPLCDNIFIICTIWVHG